MDLIPITKTKIPTYKWLTTPIKYDTDLYNRDIMNDIGSLVYQWILEKEDLILHEEYCVIQQQLIDLYIPFVTNKK